MFFLFLLRAPQETIKQPPPKESTGPKVFGPRGPREYTPESTSAPTELVRDTISGEGEIWLSGTGVMSDVPKKYQPSFDRFEKALDEWLVAHTPPVNAIEWRSPSGPLRVKDAKQMDMAGAVPFLYSKIRSLAETISRIEGVRARDARVPKETLELLQHQIEVTLNSIDTVKGNLSNMPEHLKSKAKSVATRAEEIVQEFFKLGMTAGARKAAA